MPLLRQLRLQLNLSENAEAISKMQPKLINGKVWVPDSVFGGYQQLPENDPKYMEMLLRIDSERFVELLDWIYNRDKPPRAKNV
jgi:hypothetical protein